MGRVTRSSAHLILEVDKTGARMIVGERLPAQTGTKFGYKVDAAAILESDGVISEDNLVKDRDAFDLLIKEAAKENLRGIREFIGIVPEEEVFYKVVSIPKHHMIEGGIPHALASAIPFNSVEMIIGYEPFEPISGYHGHSDYAMWAVKRAYIESYAQIFKPMGLDPKDFIPEGRALVKMAFPDYETRDAALIISVFPERSVFVVFAGRAIHFSGTLPFGYMAFEKDGPEADRFITEIQQAIFFYKHRAFHEHGASPVVNRMVIVGSLPKYLADRASFNVQIHAETPEWFSEVEIRDAATNKIIRAHPAEFASLLGALKHYAP